MSDQDFNFNPPPRREAKKGFEPPPWEKDQFDELARRKEAEAAEVTRAAADAELAEALVVAEVQAAEAEVHEPAPPKVGVPGQDPDDDSRIETMLLGLKNEEPQFGRQLWKVSLAAGAMLVAVGLVIAVWGFFAIAATGRTGALGSLGGGILVVFGLGFAGVGVWMAFRTLRQRGVL